MHDSRNPDIFDVANWFLSHKPMTHKKLQKLCYYYKAWGLALYGTDLLPNSDFEAWVHGPVNRALYAKYADYGWQKISVEDQTAPNLGEEASNVLDAVYTTYGDFSGDQLESLTHSETPWIKARGDLKPWESCTDTISEDDMRSYYRKKYEDAQND